ncbi:septum site-determining protein Ssd [Nocardia sp. CNY236]|uniref:septum site-determining protein Ssd n=1 Tax=Nocardia sp. CNY236 TaxID=1169152 RepID=UPI0006854C68|nr:septum site-determining protein Ssd [Nocardia sp. CNY236]
MNLEASASSGPLPALVSIHDDRLRDEVRRVAAAAGRELDEQPHPVGRHAWTSAPLVIVDLVAAQGAADGRYPRRPGVVLVSDGEPDLPAWRAAASVGAEQVVTLPGAAVGLIEMFAEYDEQRAGDGVVVAVVGAGGGAGASTLAVALALRGAAAEFRPGTLLVDGAPFGGGLDLMLGIEQTAGLRWPDLVVEEGRVSAAALHSALPGAAPGLAVLACSRCAAGQLPCELGPVGVRAVIEAGRVAGDFVVCDVSGERGPHADQMLDSADLVVLVVPAVLRAVAAAAAVSSHIARRNPNQGLIVRGPAPGGLRGDEVAEVLDLPLLAAVRAQSGLTHRVERRGVPVPRRGPLRDAADAVLDVLAAPAEHRW